MLVLVKDYFVSFKILRGCIFFLFYVLYAYPTGHGLSQVIGNLCSEFSNPNFKMIKSYQVGLVLVGPCQSSWFGVSRVMSYQLDLVLAL